MGGGGAKQRAASEPAPPPEKKPRKTRGGYTGAGSVQQSGALGTGSRRGTFLGGS